MDEIEIAKSYTGVRESPNYKTAFADPNFPAYFRRGVGQPAFSILSFEEAFVKQDIALMNAMSKDQDERCSGCEARLPGQGLALDAVL